MKIGSNVVHDAELSVFKLKFNKAEKEVEYMCKEIGIGSGTIHPEDQLFSTEQEAIDKCEELNKKNEDSCRYLTSSACP